MRYVILLALWPSIAFAQSGGFFGGLADGLSQPRPRYDYRRQSNQLDEIERQNQQILQEQQQQKIRQGLPLSEPPPLPLLRR